MTMANAPGWLPDPESHDQERYWNGSGWTDRVRPAGMGAPLFEPGHAPDLQRALAAATADIDAVEERLSVLFERTEAGDGGDDAGAPASATAGGAAPLARRDAGGDYGDADAAFTELDAALAAEEADQPDEPDKRGGKAKGKGRDKAKAKDTSEGETKSKRRVFRRRAKDAPSAQS
jgi:hypothetical protein